MFSHKNTLLRAAGLAVLAALLWSGNDIVTIEAVRAKDAGEALDEFVGKSVIWQSAAMAFIYVFLALNSILLDPVLIFEINDLALGSVLFELWQISRDIMNTIFAFMLVFAALYTIITADIELVKQRYAKFILGVILVNFSWLFPRIIIDVSSVAAASIYTLPQSVSGVSCSGPDGACKAVESIWFDVQNTGSCAGSAATTPSGGNPPCACEPQNAAIRPSEVVLPTPNICVVVTTITDTNTSAGILNTLYVSHMQLLELPDVPGGGPTPTRSSTISVLANKIHFAIQLLFVLFFTIAMLFPLLALAAVLLIRIPIIWVTIAFMPFMFIGFIAGDKLGSFDTMKIFREFLKAAFIPAVVGIPLVIGYIMINAMGPGSIGCDPASQIGSLGFCDPNAGLLGGYETFYEILWGFITLGVIWMGVFGALSNMGGAYAAVGNKLKGIGENWGKFALKAPLAAGLIPGPGDTRLDATNADRISRALSNPQVLIDPTSGRLSSDSVLGFINPDGSSGGARDPVANFDIRSEVANNIKQIITNNTSLSQQQLQELKRALEGAGVKDKSQAREILLSKLNLDQTKVDDALRKLDLPNAPSTN